MPGLTPWDFVPRPGPVSVKPGYRLSKLRSALCKYWTDPDKYIALVMAATGLLLALFGSVLLCVGLGLPVACYLSYRRSSHDIYTNHRVVAHDLLKFPKYAKQVQQLLHSVRTEQQQEGGGVGVDEVDDTLHLHQNSVNNHSFPLHLVLLSKALDPNHRGPVQVVGYVCVEYLGQLCSDEVQTKVETLLLRKDIDSEQFLCEMKKLGVHYDLLKRERRDLFAYTFGSVCLLKTVVVKPEFRGNGLGTVLIAYAVEKLKKIGHIDVLLSGKHPFIEHKIMDMFHGRFYTPPDFCLQKESVHWALRRETIFIPVYSSKLNFVCEAALHKFHMFEKLKKNTVAYFKTDCSSASAHSEEDDCCSSTTQVAIGAPSPRSHDADTDTATNTDHVVLYR